MKYFTLVCHFHYPIGRKKFNFFSFFILQFQCLEYFEDLNPKYPPTPQGISNNAKFNYLHSTVQRRFQEPKNFKQPVDGSYLSGIIYHTGSLVLK